MSLTAITPSPASPLCWLARSSEAKRVEEVEKDKRLLDIWTYSLLIHAMLLANMQYHPPKLPQGFI
jgi:hypothetical protein